MVALAALALAAAPGCEARGNAAGEQATHRPDTTLSRALGLTDRDRVTRVTLVGADSEEISPPRVEVRSGAWVEFVTGDWRVHEVHFELDSLAGAARAFLKRTDQVSSPPLVDLGSRFVVDFAHAPSGRYPFVAEGNTAPGHGVVVVRPRP